MNLTHLIFILAVLFVSACGGGGSGDPVAGTGNPFTKTDGTVKGDTTQTSSTVDTSIASQRVSDLQVVSFHTPGTATPGQNITINQTIANRGTGSSSNFDVSIYLSLDSVITNADIYLGSITIASLAGSDAGLASLPIAIPAGLSPGNYFIGAIIDDLGQVSEFDEENNISDPQPITINASSLYSGDDSYEDNDTKSNATPILSGNEYSAIQADADWYKLQVQPGLEKITVSVKFIHNQGDIDIALYDASQHLLASAVSVTDNEFLEFTVNQAGSYYLLVYFEDAGNSYTLTWAGSSPGTPIEPDLIVSSFSLGAVDQSGQVNVGQSITVSDTVSNIGAAIAEHFDVGIYLSEDAIITPDDTLLGYRSISSLLPGSDDVSSGSTIVIPAVNNGSYYVGAIVDDLNIVGESNEDNNASSAVAVQVGSSSVITDDQYEENDSSSSAVVIPINTPITAVQHDNDWYKLQIPSGSNRLLVNLQFLHAQGDIDLELLDSNGNVITGSYGVQDGETLETPVQSGASYYLLVYYGNSGNTYSLFWDAYDSTNAGSGIDLVMSGFSVNASSVSVGDTVTVTETVANTGSSTSGAFYVGYYLSADSTITTSDVLLGYRDAPVLLAGATDSVVYTVVIPAGFPTGTYYIGAIADDVNEVTETDESNNVSEPFSISYMSGNISSASDDLNEQDDDLLTAKSLAANTVFSGLQFDSDWFAITVQDGFLHVVIDLISSHASGDIDIELVDAQGLVLDGSYSVTDNEFIDYVVPQAGSYYIHVFYSNVGNAYTLSWQGLTASNSGSPDLIVSAMGATVSTAAGGQRQLVVTDKIENIGTGSAGSFYVGVYLSSDTDINPQLDTLLGYRSLSYLAAGFSDINSGSTLVIPGNIAAGDYTIGVFADDLDQIAEVSEINNVGSTPVTIAAPAVVVGDDGYEENDTLATARLLGEAVVASAVQLDDDWYEIQVNAGFERIVVNLLFTHAEGDIDIELYDSFGNYLSGSTGTQDNESLDFTVLTAGSYYLKVYYSNFGNAYTLSWQGLSTTSSTTPDLIVSSFTVPASALAGSSISVSNTVENIGDGYSGQFDVGIYLSNTTAIDSSSILLGYRTVSSLQSQQSNTESGTYISIPGNIAAGNYYIIPVVDDLNSVAESNESNNATTYRSIVISANVTLLDDSYEDNDDRLSATPLTEGSTVNAIQMDDDWYAIEVNSGYQRVSVSLQFTHAAGDIDLLLTDASGLYLDSSAGVSDGETIDFVVPSAGSYYLRVYYGDAGNSYTLTWSGLNSSSVGQPDLVVDVFSVSTTTLAAGGTLDITAETVSNIGTADSAQFDIGYYLSTDTTITETDIFIGYRTVTSLVSGGSTTSSGSFTVSGSTPVGSYYVGALADDLNDIAESDEFNNNIVSSNPITVTAPVALIDDVYEDNDSFSTATIIPSGITSLTGIQADDDWYAINLTAGNSYTFNLLFTHNEGDIDMEIFDAGFNYIDGSYGIVDNETVTLIPAVSGAYYVNIYYDNAGNSYTLTW